MAEKTKTKNYEGVNEALLKSLIGQLDKFTAKANEEGGKVGALVKKAEDAHGLHRKAFKFTFMLYKMEPPARNDFLRAADDYRAKLKLDDSPDMLDSTDDQAGEEAAQPPADDVRDPEPAEPVQSIAEANAKVLKGIRQKKAPTPKEAAEKVFSSEPRTIIPISGEAAPEAISVN